MTINFYREDKAHLIEIGIKKKTTYMCKEKSSYKWEEKSNNKSEEKKAKIKKVMTRVDKEILLHYV